MGEKTWAAEEFEAAEFGDARLTRRLVELAGVLAEKPSASFPEACEDRAQLKAAYRFFDHEEVTPAGILASHIAATRRRMAEEPVVLAVQDTTQLDYTHHPATTGLGVLNDAKHRGLLLHGTVAFTPERVPLGVMAERVWRREEADLGKRAKRKERPITDKESQKWLDSLQAVIAAKAACPPTHFVSVGDREADVYDLFVVERPPGVDLLIRAAWDRCVAGPQPHLWEAVAAAPVAGTLTLTVPRRGEQPARTAHLTIHWAPVTLRPPRGRAAERLPSCPVTAVWAVETHPPPGVPPIEWLLLTTLPVGSFEDATRCLEWYACRWGIELWHKILKSGCHLEARQLASADRLERCLALFSVIAWRILWATWLARAAPDLPCSVLLDPDEWQALFCQIHRTPSPPDRPPSLRQAVHWIAQLGGFLARPRDGDPGMITLWRGFQRLHDLTTMFQLFHPPPFSPSTSPQQRSG